MFPFDDVIMNTSLPATSQERSTSSWIMVGRKLFIPFLWKAMAETHNVLGITATSSDFSSHIIANPAHDLNYPLLKHWRLLPPLWLRNYWTRKNVSAVDKHVCLMMSEESVLVLISNHIFCKLCHWRISFFDLVWLELTQVKWIINRKGPLSSTWFY